MITKTEFYAARQVSIVLSVFRVVSRTTHYEFIHRSISKDFELEKEIEVSNCIALTEDIGSGDISAALIPDGLSLEAITITRSKGVFCGAAWVEAIIRQVDHALTVEWSVTDGDKIQADQSLFVLRGPARGILDG